MNNLCQKETNQNQLSKTYYSSLFQPNYQSLAEKMDKQNLNFFKKENKNVMIDKKHFCLSLDEKTFNINIPMADDPMTISGLFLNSFNFKKDNEKNIKQFETHKRSPPMASEDDLSESELSDLELRVACGDFNVTPRVHSTIENFYSNKFDEKNKQGYYTDEYNNNIANNFDINKRKNDGTTKKLTLNNYNEQSHSNSKNFIFVNEKNEFLNQLKQEKLLQCHMNKKNLKKKNVLNCLSSNQFWLNKSLSMPNLSFDQSNYNLENSKFTFLHKNEYVKNINKNNEFKRVQCQAPNINSKMTYSFTADACAFPQNNTVTINNCFFVPQTQQKRILPLRPDELETVSSKEIFDRQPYQQRVLCLNNTADVNLLSCSYQITQESNNQIDTNQLQKKHQRRLPQIPQKSSTIAQTFLQEPKTEKEQNLLQKDSRAEYIKNFTISSALDYTRITTHNSRKDYQLLYGLDKSSNHKQNSSSKQNEHESFCKKTQTMRCGLMNEIYYEDDNLNINANFDVTKLNGKDISKNSLYNLTDVENSSGISSCCTSASTTTNGIVTTIPSFNESNYNNLLNKNKQTSVLLPINSDIVCKNNELNKELSKRSTHRVQFTFVPRHNDEILLEIGDALHVERVDEDYWCYGINLRSNQIGIFPLAHICEIDLVNEICQSALAQAANLPTQIKDERDTFYLTMLASIEVAHHKGNDVLIQAINKVCLMYQKKDEILVPQTVLVEISFRGIHVIDKRKKDFFRCPTFDFFYSLQNISFCGAHPKHLKYFGFITKHPLLPRFACHVFFSHESTQPIVEAIGRAFKRSYDAYMSFAHPTEDIYIE